MDHNKLWEIPKEMGKPDHLVYLIYRQSASCEMLGWMHYKRIKIARRNINNLRYADDTSLLEENEEELKSLLMKVKGSEKAKN